MEFIENLKGLGVIGIAVVVIAYICVQYIQNDKDVGSKYTFYFLLTGLLSIVVLSLLSLSSETDEAPGKKIDACQELIQEIKKKTSQVYEGFDEITSQNSQGYILSIKFIINDINIIRNYLGSHR